MNDRSSDVASIVSFLAGAVAGVTIALVLAPESGDAARSRIGRDLRDAADSARDLTDRVIRRGEQIADEGARRVTAVGSALSGGRTPTGPAPRREVAPL